MVYLAADTGNTRPVVIASTGFILTMLSQGSVIIYQHAIQPFLSQHESRIDRALLDLQKQARRTGLEYGKRGIAILNSALGDLLVKVSQAANVGLCSMLVWRDCDAFVHWL
jgi:hypothetical protein